MAALKNAGKRLLCWALTLSVPVLANSQPVYEPQGSEFPIAGSLLGDQVFPDVALRPGGGFVVWQDNATDGNGDGVSAQRLDSSFSGVLSPFRVNQQAAGDQNHPRVALLNDGGAVFVWQGGKQGFQKIYARFLSSSNTWATGDILINTYTNSSQLSPAVAVLNNGNVVVVWASFNQEATNSLQGVYGQLLSPAGLKLGGEFRVNQATAFNQRLPVVSGLSDGRFVVAWVTEQQRFVNSVDIFARFYGSGGAPAGSEFLLNTTTNITGHPSLAAAPDGGFLAAWSERDSLVRSNNWDIVARSISASGVGGTARRVNATSYGDQLAPRVSAVGSEYCVTWMSMGQDGSREGVYGRFLHADGAFAAGEFRVNTTTVSQQMHPVSSSDRAGRFMVVWSSFGGGAGSFDLQAQRYASSAEPLPTPDPPFVSVLSSNALSVTWPALAGFSVASYELYVDGATTPTATVTSNIWKLTGLAPASTHGVKLAFVLTDGRRSPLSATASGTTYGTLTYGGIPYDWMVQNFGPDIFSWPSPFIDSDGDGATNLREFEAGTNPMNASSVLRLRLQPTSQGLYINWNTQPGLMYQVQVSTGLGQWSDLGGIRFAAGYLDSMYLGLSNQAYYRVSRLR